MYDFFHIHIIHTTAVQQPSYRMQKLNGSTTTTNGNPLPDSNLQKNMHPLSNAIPFFTKQDCGTQMNMNLIPNTPYWRCLINSTPSSNPSTITTPNIMNTPNMNPPLSQTQNPKSKNRVDNQVTAGDCPPPHAPMSQVEEIQTTMIATECSDQTKKKKR